ncbi:hypothetical protein F2Q70_00022603 [Brassica cretica]|uniref:Beta-galactosidase n=1 Tax=Brassica cretica TaxID=69181 RepID=A0A8S9GJW5_BRACR|nr:hypothetical protein F2Q70_00022603 [Brassica cretica]
MVNSWEPLYSGVHRDRSKTKFDYGWYITKFKIDDSDLKNKGSKPTVIVSNVGHALHVWLNGEYHGKIEKLQHLDVMFRELEYLMNLFRKQTW